METKNFLQLAGTIFALVALAHLLRALMGLSVTIDRWDVPVWLSWLAFVIAGGLSYSGFHLARRK